MKKSTILREIEQRNIVHIKYFAKGHRGLLFTAKFKNCGVVIKIKNPESRAIGRIQNEAEWLRILNKHGIGPKLLFCSKAFIAYKYIFGDFISDYIKKSNKDKIVDILYKVLMQLYKMDKLNITKGEMHHPYKHIIVTKNKLPVMIDFERCHKSLRPKNVSQFCQFLLSSRIAEILKSKNIILDKNRLINTAKIYKNDICLVNVKRIIKYLNEN